MNKKFSTLVAALLLSGALGTVYATDVKSIKDLKIDETTNKLANIADGKLVLIGNIDLGDHPYLLIDQDGLEIDGQGQYTLKGRLAITAENVTVQNLKIENIVKNNNGSFWKNAITVVGSNATITGNEITCGADKSASQGANQIANGIVVFPTVTDASYTISKNTIKDADVVANDGTLSSGILVAENCTYPSGQNEFSGSSKEITDFNATALADNTFENCYMDYCYDDWSNASSVKNFASPKAFQFTPIVENGNVVNAKALTEEAINNVKEGASVTFNGTVEQLKKALGDTNVTADVAVACDGENVLFGTVENPDNGQPAVIAGVKTMPEKLFDVLELAKEAPSDYRLLIQLSPDPANKSYYAIVADASGKPEVVQIMAANYATIAADPNALWSMTKTELAGNVYYTFENQNEVTLKIEGGDEMALKGALRPVNNAEYNKGVVFALDGKQDDGKWYLGTSEDKKSIFGLYEAGKNVLTVEDLNYFEQDGFSVTIKYQDADGKFTKEDIAGNEFVGHLTPMKWDFEKKEFVEALATDKEFYLKNADGEYIVVNAKDNGDVAAEDVLYFTTLSEEALEHHLVADDEQEYFGLFQALVSASNQTDYKKLTALDELEVFINGTPASVGRWDKGGEPTLAASIATSLKPIQIALGSDKIVKAKDLLKKGKFYTIEGIASTSEDDYRVGKKLVAGAQSDENDYYWVKSYGNVLEGQFALTIASDKDGKEYYVFTNRENPDMLTYGLQRFELPNGGFSYGIPVGSLYTTDEDNEYRWGVLTMKIDTVAGHKASDGYQTLADVKNNKFYIGYASGVFGGNAWLVENHEGDENHVIGLDINQEDALIFTAKEYAAARQLKVEDKKSHKYYYAPSDSIYVISELGYFDGDDYKTTLDTLKLVSYSFVNQYTEPLIFSKNGENRYESKVYDYYKYNDKTGKYDIGVRYKNVEEAQKDAQHFALRIDGTKLNLRPVNPTVYSKDGNNVEVIKDSWSNIAWTEAEYKNLGDDETKPDAYLYQGLNGNYKIYSGDAGEEGMLSNTNYLDREENDLFVVEPTEKPMYRTVINPLDTISIFRDDNSQSVLFEHNTFLGMENLSQYPEIAKAMIADTAYVRNNTYRPQYMLVVGADITPAGKWCPIHGDDPTCPDAHKVETSGWVEGRYLVNLVDTAIAWDAANKHKDNNPYINSEKYYRLGFVQAKHINDSLVIASTNDTLYVGSEDYNQAKFAFRYVDQEAGSFVIETANYNRLPGVEEAEINENAPLGYLKWMNGVVVVVDDINNADVYNMNENETDTPTANEDIAVEEGVEVIAGNGAVTIQGAAGKTVVITNILGKAVANTTLTSDNQTINVPAGIVVVTVDGEAVKAIVK